MSSFYFLQAQETERNHAFLASLKQHCNAAQSQAYVINRPLGDQKYSYEQRDWLVLLMPKQQISFLNFSGDENAFNEYVEDFIEDLGSLSDKFRYKDVIGRPRSWREDLIALRDGTSTSLQDLLADTRIQDPSRQRVCELLISLLTGSVNDIDRIKAEAPHTLLDKVKQKIQLFDGDQTRFVYQKLDHSPVRIQGLSGTGKTELLLHKLKDIFVADNKSRITFTCHNRILADNMRRRLPEFFNFMKVEQQIQWGERLWCMHAWGSASNKDSGTYRYICDFYGIPFLTYNAFTPFDQVCKQALTAVKHSGGGRFAFDYMFVDESQDFPDSFFALCSAVTRHTVYIAGDIFQGIFDETPARSVAPDFLLSKCYRTDPRTLMFAHALGMGLFEQKKLRWLEDDEWKACGYLVEKANRGTTYRLRREPLRRFEDVERENRPSVEIVSGALPFYDTAAQLIIGLLRRIQDENPTATPDDVGIILLDPGNQTYRLADELEQLVPRSLGYTVNKAYESKRRERGSLFVSNRNNVKGLEFPFVICVTESIGTWHTYRNALYMTLTRSFLQTFLVVADSNAPALAPIAAGLATINRLGYIEATAPSEPEKEKIKTTIKYTASAESYFDFLAGIFEELGVPPIFRDSLTETVKAVAGEDFDRENVKEIVAFNFRKMSGK